MKIAMLVGARPQFIKASVVSRALAEHKGVQEILIHTGQHSDLNMSDVFFDELDIPSPNHHLGIGGGSHGENTGRMIEAIERVLIAERPDWLLVFGDTDSTLAGAIAAAKLHIPVAHVEAGLRSFNRRMPEEINRVLTDHVSTILFAPTDTAVRNLAAEGIKGSSVQLVGDVMYDALRYYGEKSEARMEFLNALKIAPNGYVLATLHREENTDDRQRLGEILAGFAASPLPVILPLHPRTRKRLKEFALTIPSTIQIIAPVGYLDMVLLEKHAAMIATDSGGVQKEAYFHGVPCLTLRDETEWVELLDAGANRLVGANCSRLAEALRDDWKTLAPPQPSLYGDGHAGRRIVRILLENTLKAV